MLHQQRLVRGCGLSAGLDGIKRGADHLEEFNIPAIMECLAAHPDLVAISHTECGDIRGPGGWFFGTTEAGEHIVGVAGGKDIEVFPSELHACAEFIRRQVLDLIGHREHLHALTRPDYRPQ